MAEFGDKVVIEIVGVDPDGVPDAVRVEYFSEGRRVYPGLSDGSWGAFRIGALRFVREWWEARDDDV